MRSRAWLLAAVFAVAIAVAAPAGGAGASPPATGADGTSTVTYTGTINNTVELPDSTGHVSEILSQNYTWTATWTGPTSMISDSSGQTVTWTSVSLSGSDSIQYLDSNQGAGQSQNCSDTLSATPSQTFNAILPYGGGTITFGINTPQPQQAATAGGGCSLPARLACPPGSPPNEGASSSYCSPGPGWKFKDGAQSFDLSSNYGPTDVGGKIVTSNLTSTVSVSGAGCELGNSSAAAASARAGGPRAFAAAAPKPNVVFYSARGSSEVRSRSDPLELGSPGLALYQVLKRRADVAGIDLFVAGDPYPALDIQLGFYLDYKKNKAATTHYGESVAAGVRDGVANLEEMASKQDATGKCWSLVLSGYSQGAEVMRRVIAALPGDVLAHVAAVELFGDPYFKPFEPNVFPRGGSAPNAIGARRFAWIHFGGPPPPPIRTQATYSWCHPHDLVCGFNNSLLRGLGVLPGTDEGKGHFTYDQEACKAADQVSRRLTARGVDLGSGC